ncbi:MAG: transposase [Opitutales bacterium]|nr:transposase [Opitutales bacterium]
MREKVESCYHVVSRINWRAFVLGETEKEAFRDLLRRVAGFCGVDVLTFAILDNHFHLLVRVPGTVGELSDGELLERAALIYGSERKHQPLSLFRIGLALQAGGEVRTRMRSLLMERMASLPMFVKLLKQRFSILFNRAHDRVGTLWEDRFHSVLVEDSAAALRAVGAYIDLNAVRAGIVGDPKDYRWSGYGEAAGSRLGLKGYRLFAHLAGKHAESLEQVAAAYRRYLYVAGSAPGKGAVFGKEEIEAVLQAGGELSRAQLLRCRLRYMTRGAVIGTKAFVSRWMGRGAGKQTAANGALQAASAEGEDLLGDGLCAGRPRID